MKGAKVRIKTGTELSGRVWCPSTKPFWSTLPLIKCCLDLYFCSVGDYRNPGSSGEDRPRGTPRAAREVWSRRASRHPRSCGQYTIKNADRMGMILSHYEYSLLSWSTTIKGPPWKLCVLQYCKLICNSCVYSPGWARFKWPNRTDWTTRTNSKQ